VDFGFSGVPFTYDNRQDGNNNIRVRLDRACADEQLRDMFPATKVLHVASSCSDHCPLVVQLVPVEVQQRSSIPRYEIMCERNPSLPQVVAQSWEKFKPQGDLGSVAGSLKRMMHSLRSWSLKNFGHVNCEIEKLRTEIANLQEGNADRYSIRQKMNVLDELLYWEEMILLQRARIIWLKQVERNTQYLSGVESAP
jgi:hypothetical protein